MYSNQMQVRLPGPLRHPSAADSTAANTQRTRNSTDSLSVILELLQRLVAHQTGISPQSVDCIRKAEYLQKLLQARIETSWSQEHQIRDRMRDQIGRIHKTVRPIQREFLQTKLDDLVRKLSSKGTNNLKILKVLTIFSESRLANPSLFSSRAAANQSIMANLPQHNFETQTQKPTLSYQPAASPALMHEHTSKQSAMAGLLRFLRDCATVGEVENSHQGLFFAQVVENTQDDPFKEYGVDQDFVDQLSKQKQDNHKEKKGGPLLSVKLSNLLPLVEIRCAVSPALDHSEWTLLVELLKTGVHLTLIKECCRHNTSSQHSKSKIRRAFTEEVLSILSEARVYFDSELQSASAAAAEPSEENSFGLAEALRVHLGLSNMQANSTSVAGKQHKSLLGLFNGLQSVCASLQSLLVLVEVAVGLPPVHLLSLLRRAAGGQDAAAQRLLQRAALPFVEACLHWMRCGEVLPDAREDTFVRGGGDKPMWEEEHWVDMESVPAIIDEEAARLIFSIGRTTALERKMGFHVEKPTNLMDIEEKGDNHEDSWAQIENGMRELHLGKNIEAFKSEIASFARERERHLLAKYKDKSGIVRHLSYLKKTMFMKRGDVIDNLIKAAASVLDLPAKDVYYHNIMPLFDDVIQKSNLKNTPDQALGVKLLEPGLGDTGWDIFCIEYRFPEYLQHIFNPQVSLKLLRLWHHLFKLKRCSTKLSEVWLELRLLTRLSSQNQSMENFVNELNSYRNNMSEFLANLSSYIFTEVIENQLDKFMEDVAKIESLEELKSKTHNLVDNMLAGAFLERDPLDLYRSISFLLNSCFRFCKAFSVATQYCLLEVDERGKVVVKDPNERLAALQVERKIKKYRLSDTFPIESFATMTRKIWEEYHRSYLRFLVRLTLTPQTRTFSFKFDFNQYHCNSNMEIIAKVFQEEKLKVFPKN